MTLRRAYENESAELAHLESSADALYRTVGHPEIDSGAAVTGDYARLAVEQGRVLVAELEGRLVGFVCVDRLDGELFIKQVSVLPDFCRRGIGSALMQAMIDAARIADEASIVLDTQADVPWNRPWYERLGFVVVPEESWTPGMRALTAKQVSQGFDWRTRVHMRLTIHRASPCVGRVSKRSARAR